MRHASGFWHCCLCHSYLELHVNMLSVLFVLMSSQLGVVTICVDSSSMHSSLSSLLLTSIFLFPTLMSMRFSARHVIHLGEPNENVRYRFSKNRTEPTSNFKYRKLGFRVWFSKTDFGSLGTVFHVISFTIHFPT